MLNSNDVKMSSLLDIGCLFLIALIITCIFSKGYLRYFIVALTVIYYLIGNGILGTGINHAFGELGPALSAYDRIFKVAEVYNKYP